MRLHMPAFPRSMSNVMLMCLPGLAVLTRCACPRSLRILAEPGVALHQKAHCFAQLFAGGPGLFQGLYVRQGFTGLGGSL